MKRGVGRFFAYARARHRVYLARAAGKPRPWSDDHILESFRFTNVFRELDKTTAWFAKYVRDPMRDRPEVLLATVVFRLLNRIEVGEAIFLQSNLTPSGGMRHYPTAFEGFLETGDTDYLKHAIKIYCGRGPYVTGAYIISSPPGYSKLDGMMEVIGRFAKGANPAPTHGEFPRPLAWEDVARRCLDNQSYGLESMFEWLKQFDYLGKFHSYEIVTDLRHTALLDRAPDIMTWASPGPGARRGLNRVHAREYTDKSLSRGDMIAEMRELLSLSRDAMLWPAGKTPKKTSDYIEWPKWEMRDVEHTLCEFDKYERVRLGQGRPRGVYR